MPLDQRVWKNSLDLNETLCSLTVDLTNIVKILFNYSTTIRSPEKPNKKK